MSDVITIRPVGAELFHADGRTDGHDEANTRFSQFSEKRLKTESPKLFYYPFIHRVKNGHV
jgi:hypothetical protein